MVREQVRRRSRQRRLRAREAVVQHLAGRDPEAEAMTDAAADLLVRIDEALASTGEAA